MSQSRMKEIQDIVGLAPSNNSMRSLAYGTRGSWVEMLVGSSYHRIEGGC
jgi:hypothetical protein